MSDPNRPADEPQVIKEDVAQAVAETITYECDTFEEAREVVVRIFNVNEEELLKFIARCDNSFREQFQNRNGKFIIEYDRKEDRLRFYKSIGKSELLIDFDIYLLIDMPDLDEYPGLKQAVEKSPDLSKIVERDRRKIGGSIWLVRGFDDTETSPWEMVRTAFTPNKIYNFQEICQIFMHLFGLDAGQLSLIFKFEHSSPFRCSINEHRGIVLISATSRNDEGEDFTIKQMEINVRPKDLSMYLK